MWYHKSKLYDSFDKEDPEDFEFTLQIIPTQCKKPNTNLNNVEDVRNLFHTMRYWDVYEIPRSLFEYADKRTNNFNENDYEDFFR